jgi:hypothetical protein
MMAARSPLPPDTQVRWWFTPSARRGSREGRLRSQSGRRHGPEPHLSAGSRRGVVWAGATGTALHLRLEL